MRELRYDGQARGMRVTCGPERRQLINSLGEMCESYGFEEIVLPTIEHHSVYQDKLGTEATTQMWEFSDRKGRPCVLRPEGTATCQALARSAYKDESTILIWYEARCFRYERPQAGRYREFTQFGVEVLNPKSDWSSMLINLATEMVRSTGVEYELHNGVKRGLGYYTADGFEVVVPSLGAQQQVVGGGPYAEGIGFAVGIDRLLLATIKEA